MNNNIVKVNLNDGTTMDCYLLAILTINEKLFMVYKETTNNSFTNDLLCSKIVSKKGEVYNLVPLEDNEWTLVEEEYKKVINVK